MLAAVLVVRIAGFGEKYAVQHFKALYVACADAEDYEVLTLAAGIDDVDILALDLEIHKVFGLGEEEILCASDGIERVGKLFRFVPLLICRAGFRVYGEIQRMVFGNCRKHPI